MDAEVGDYLALLRGVPREQAARVLPRLRSHLRKEGVEDWRSVGAAQLHGFVLALRERQLRPWTVYSYTSSVRCFFGFLFARGRILWNPAETLRLKTPRRLPRAMPSEDELRRLMGAKLPEDALELRDRAVVELLYGTGIRCGECSRLDLEDVDLRGGSLFVREGKGARDRIVPLVGRAREALGEYLGEARAELAHGRGETAVFLAWRGGVRLGGYGVRHALCRAQRLIGGGSLTPHLLRHACATHLLAGGADIRHVQLLLGHRWIETTALYTRVEGSVLRRAIEEAHPLGARHGTRRGTSRSLLRRRILRGAFVRGERRVFGH